MHKNHTMEHQASPDTIIAKKSVAHPASFRDPAGFLFRHDGILYRQVNKAYKEDFNLLTRSGLYKKACDAGCMVPHESADDIPFFSDDAYCIIRPEQIDFISYPYEWCFSELKDAALTTLDLQLMALRHNMILKDATAYNIQFRHGRPVMIDTLSFECYKEGTPWPAYKQFCQHFLAPLALMAKTDIRLNSLLRDYIDGIPLEMASRLLPFATWFKPGLLINLHLHAKAQRAYGKTSVRNKPASLSGRRISKLGLTGIIEGLRKTVEKLTWRPSGTEWAEYYTFTNYSDNALQQKKSLIQNYLKTIQPGTVWDLGANTGLFSRLASEEGMLTIAFDIDPAAVEINYQNVRRNREKNLLPLLADLTTPSPALGWDCDERYSLHQRGPADCILALALVHHLAISNNVPFEKIASFLRKLCKYLIIEFVPKQDSQVQRLLGSRPDIFTDYNRDFFELSFSNFFQIVQTNQIAGSERWLYLMQNKNK